MLVDDVPARMITDVDGETTMVFGIPLSGVGAYFEFFDVGEDDRTLSNVALSLLLASVITTLLGVLLGVFAARRAVRPVADAAQAAKAIAGGHLGTRLPPTDDPDLGVLASSFNDMASALQVRIERDARFASDVSHELRSPLMTLSASVEVMEARRHELPERSQAALDLLTSDVSRFQGLVEDLLEISRFDAGAIRLHLEDLPVVQFVCQRRRRQLGTAHAGHDDRAGRATPSSAATGVASPASSPTSSTTPRPTAVASRRSRSPRATPPTSRSPTSASVSRTTDQACRSRSGR